MRHVPTQDRETWSPRSRKRKSCGLGSPPSRGRPSGISAYLTQPSGSSMHRSEAAPFPDGGRQCPCLGKHPMPSGLRKGLTSYGDPGFSLFLRKAFIKAKGFSDDALDRPIIGVTDTYSDFNPCHGNVPQLIEAVKRGVMLAGGLPMEFPTDLDPRELLAPDLDVPAQPDVDRHRGDGARAADGRRGADRRLRQDAARAGDGRGLGRQARDRGADRPDGGRPSQGRGARRLHRLPPAVGAAPRRQDGRGRDRSGERAARAVGRHLHGDGHREHHGLRDRGARLLAALCGGGAGRACGAHPHRRGERQTGGRDGQGRLAAAARAVHRTELAQRADRAAGDRRLDQRHRASRRDGGARRHHARSRCVRRAVEAGAGADRPEAVGRPLHGALPSRRRRAAADAGAVRHPRPRRPDGRRHACATTSRSPSRCRARPSSARAPIRSTRRARCACCAATSRRAAR